MCVNFFFSCYFSLCVYHFIECLSIVQAFSLASNRLIDQFLIDYIIVRILSPVIYYYYRYYYYYYSYYYYFLFYDEDN